MLELCSGAYPQDAAHLALRCLLMWARDPGALAALDEATNVRWYLNQLVGAGAVEAGTGPPSEGAQSTPGGPGEPGSTSGSTGSRVASAGNEAPMRLLPVDLSAGPALLLLHAVQAASGSSASGSSVGSTAAAPPQHAGPIAAPAAAALGLQAKQAQGMEAAAGGASLMVPGMADEGGAIETIVKSDPGMADSLGWWRAAASALLVDCEHLPWLRAQDIALLLQRLVIVAWRAGPGPGPGQITQDAPEALWAALPAGSTFGATGVISPVAGSGQAGFPGWPPLPLEQLPWAPLDVGLATGVCPGEASPARSRPPPSPPAMALASHGLAALLGHAAWCSGHAHQGMGSLGQATSSHGRLVVGLSPDLELPAASAEVAAAPRTGRMPVPLYHHPAVLVAAAAAASTATASQAVQAGTGLQLMVPADAAGLHGNRSSNSTTSRAATQGHQGQLHAAQLHGLTHVTAQLIDAVCAGLGMGNALGGSRQQQAGVGVGWGTATGGDAFVALVGSLLMGPSVGSQASSQGPQASSPAPAAFSQAVEFLAGLSRSPAAPYLWPALGAHHLGSTDLPRAALCTALGWVLSTCEPRLSAALGGPQGLGMTLVMHAAVKWLGFGGSCVPGLAGGLAFCGLLPAAEVVKATALALTLGPDYLVYLAAAVSKICREKHISLSLSLSLTLCMPSRSLIACVLGC